MTTTKKPVPLMELIAKMTGQTIDQIYNWSKEEWLAFAQKLRETPQKPTGQ